MHPWSAIAIVGCVVVVLVPHLIIECRIEVVDVAELSVHPFSPDIALLAFFCLAECISFRIAALRITWCAAVLVSWSNWVDVVHGRYAFIAAP